MSDHIYVGGNVATMESSPAFQPYTKVVLIVGKESDGTQIVYEAGNDTGATLEVENPWGTQAIANDILSRISGYAYRPFEATGAMLDQAAELGDAVTVNGVYSVLAEQDTTFGALSTSVISAPQNGELEQEYPYLSTSDRKIERRINNVETSFTVSVGLIQSQITQEVNRAEGAETALSTTITQTAQSIRTEVAQGHYSKSEINQMFNSITLSVTNNGTSSSITISGDKITTQSRNIVLSGFVTFTDLSTSGSTTIHGDNISTGTVTTSKLLLTGWLHVYDSTAQTSSAMFGYAQGDDGSGTPTYGAMIRSSVTANSYVIVTNAGVRMTAGTSIWVDSNGGHCSSVFSASHIAATDSSQPKYYFGPYANYNAFLTYWYSSVRDEYFITSMPTTVGMRCTGRIWGALGEFSGNVMSGGNVTATGYMYAVGNISAGGDMWCSGTKSRAVETEDYGSVLLYAMESATPMFSDMGSGDLDETGVAYIFFDPDFMETVELRHDYQVFLTQTGAGAVRYAEKHTDHFIVHGDAGATFDWIAYCRQRDYETTRLEQINYDIPEMDDIAPEDEEVYIDEEASV